MEFFPEFVSAASIIRYCEQHYPIEVEDQRRQLEREIPNLIGYAEDHDREIGMNFNRPTFDVHLYRATSPFAWLDQLFGIRTIYLLRHRDPEGVIHLVLTSTRVAEREPLSDDCDITSMILCAATDPAIPMFLYQRPSRTSVLNSITCSQCLDKVRLHIWSRLPTTVPAGYQDQGIRFRSHELPYDVPFSIEEDMLMRKRRQRLSPS